MNNVSIVGRLTKDVEMRRTENSSIASFTVAVDRKYKTDNGPTADFINCKAFGKSAEFIEKYFSKGQRIGISGRIQTGSYTNKENQKVYTTEVIVEGVEFVESRNNNSTANTAATNEGWMNVPDGIEEELPFN